MTQKALNAVMPVGLKSYKDGVSKDDPTRWKWKVRRSRCFLRFELYSEQADITRLWIGPTGRIEEYVLKIIHLPGLRGNPERTYKTSAIGDKFPGTFENYVASIVYSWQNTKDKRLGELAKALETVGLTSQIEAKQLNDTQVELRVGRLAVGSPGKAADMVSIADVGLGVSQTLPVLVALLVAEPGQLVYIEQPEIHLHPRAQAALAQVLADAANRGVRVVVETHSSLLILGVQSLVAEGKLAPDKVILHWFQRGDDGATTITSADLDKAGAFGDWPEDFDDVDLEMQKRYLDASELRLIESLHASNNLEEARY